MPSRVRGAPVSVFWEGSRPLSIVLRMDEGTKLAAANHANVTFEVDQIDLRILFSELFERFDLTVQAALLRTALLPTKR